MKVCKSLRDRLDVLSSTLGLSVQDLWEQLLYEVPDEALQEFHAMAEPVDLEVSEEIELVTAGLAEAFGMTVLGMSVLMDTMLDRTMAVNARVAEYENEGK